MLAGIRKMLALVLYSEKTIKDAVINAYKQLYLADREMSNVDTAKQLLRLVQDLSVCERVSLEELIGEFAKQEQLHNGVIQIFWEIFASAEQQPQHRLNALILLGMVIKKLPSRGKANIQVEFIRNFITVYLNKLKQLSLNYLDITINACFIN